MPSGGARVVSGPPPDPNALRRERDGHLWTTLPVEGRQGETPAWPLTAQSPREEELWELLWSRPQAVMWERLDQSIEVAMFVRKLAEAERPKASVELQKVVRQYLDSLGLSVQGMLRNRWRLSDPGAATEPKAPSRKPAARRTVRSRLKVVPVAEAGD